MVADDDQPPWVHSVGFQDTALGSLMREDHIFRIYSMTKPVVSFAALMQCQEGLLTLDEPITTWLPEFQEMQVFARGADGWVTEPARRAITVRDLLRHTAGFGYGTDPTHHVDRLYKKHEITRPLRNLEETVKQLATLPLKRHPGESFHYGLSTDVLGRLMEVVDGLPLDELLRRRIFDPLQMQDTGFYVPANKADRLVALHRREVNGKMKPIEAAAVSRYLKPPVLLSGGAGLLSTAADFGNFARMLAQQGRFGARQLLDHFWMSRMITNQLPGQAKEIIVGLERRVGVGFGLGVYVRVESSEREPHSGVGDFGWSGSAGTHYWRSPSQQRSVVALSQYFPYSTRLKRSLQAALDDSGS